MGGAGCDRRRESPDYRLTKLRNSAERIGGTPGDESRIGAEPFLSEDHLAETQCEARTVIDQAPAGPRARVAGLKARA